MKLSADQITDISEKIYRKMLAQSAGGSDHEWRAREADRMIEKFNAKGQDGPAKFRRFAAQYDHIVRAVLEVVGYEA